MTKQALLVQTGIAKWLQVFRDITNSTNERTLITAQIRESAVGHTGSLIDYEEHTRAVAATLVLANMNSIPFDWTTRLSVGGTHMSFFIVKQLPILPPEAYLERVRSVLPTYVELIVPRSLELTFTADDLEDFAKDLGYNGQPFPWDERRRHMLRCELDAIYAHMYGLERSELASILDAPPPSSSFPALKSTEMKEFGEYRTKRYVLQAYDQLCCGEIPDLNGEPTT